MAECVPLPATPSHVPRFRLLAALLLAAAAVPIGARAQLNQAVPAELEGVGIDERLGARVPLDARFVDETGREVRLGELLSRGRPVVLTLGYYECPMLCSLVLNGLVVGLRDVPWTPGREFELVTLSINPLETPALAARKKANYLESYAREGAAAGWHFMTGRDAEIRRLAAAVGFRYTYNRERGEYAHAAGIFFLTPDGRVARVLYGVQFQPRDLKLALTEAGEGRVGGSAEQILLYCFHYDAGARGYVLAAENLMRVTGLATALLLGGWLVFWWRRGARATGAARRD